MRIAICDDENEQVQENMSLIERWADGIHLSVSIDTFSSSEEFLFRWSEGHPYDLAIFDIKMRQMTGIELAKIVRKSDQDLQIVFITGITHHVFEGYDVSALNYLVKPYKPSLFINTLDRAYTIYKQKELGALMVSHESRLIRVPFPDILYMEIRGHYFDIYTIKNVSYRAKKNMDEMLSLLDKRLFARCHRSYIINVFHVVALGRLEVKLRTGQAIPVSQTYIQQVTQLFVDYHHRYNLPLNNKH